MADIKIEEYNPETGRMLKEDGTIISLADCITSDVSGNVVIRAISST